MSTPDDEDVVAAQGRTVDTARLWILTIDGQEWGAYESEERACEYAESWYRAGVRGMDLHTIEVDGDMDAVTSDDAADGDGS